MKAIDRFLEYVTVYTTSSEAGEGCPSTPRQFDLAKRLVDEMRELGIADARVDGHCYVYGSIPASPGCEEAPAIGLIAHLDTSPDCGGEKVKPLLHPGYNGQDVQLPSGHCISTGMFPALKALKGQTLVTASGNTLLGADDKAGIAEILTACEQLLCGGLPHPRVCVAFTPDEEIGRGADLFDVAAFGAKYAYTVDGGAVEEIEYESFNAAAAKLCFKGVEVHPGAAKDIMVNAAGLAAEFDGLLPGDERPRHTEGRQGFFHLTELCGSVGSATASYIIRDHDRARFEQRKRQMQEAARALEAAHGKGCVELTITDSYYNMGEVIEKHWHLVENAMQAVRAAGLEPVTKIGRAHV